MATRRVSPEEALELMRAQGYAYLDVRSDTGAMGRFIRMKQVVGGRVDNLIVDAHVPFANVAGEVRAVTLQRTAAGGFTTSVVTEN